jgi:arylsulfatase
MKTKTCVLPVLLAVLVSLTSSLFSTTGAPIPERPDIIFILADDMGYSDPGCFGGELKTPALDRLASSGLVVSRFHNGGMCVVSRLSLMTGRWWPSAQREFGTQSILPEILREKGYRTALIGKWHLAGHPMDRGFDRFYGFLGGFADHFNGSKDFQNDRAPVKEQGPDYYSSAAFSKEAAAFIDETHTANPKQPLFLYLSFQAPHNPLQAPEADIARHRGKYRGGWQAIREARFAKQKQLGLVPPHAVLPAYPQNLPDWNSLSPGQQDLEDLRMATYAAMVEGMDAGIARVMQALEKCGRAENTIVIFTSDNGPDSFSVMDKALLKQGKLPGDRNSNFQPGTGWAYATATPWRLYKISQHAGGITAGGIVHWPAGLKQPGRTSGSPVHLIDVMPTLLDAIGAAKPLPCDGESFLPLIRNDPWSRNDPMFFQYADNRAIRNGSWTLAEVDGKGWELFDTREDLLECHDLSASNPEMVSKLATEWLNWWKHHSRKNRYQPDSTKDSPHYSPQGDRGSGKPYVPSSMKGSVQ